MKTGIAVVVALLAAPAALAGVPDTLLYQQSPVSGPGFASSAQIIGPFSTRYSDSIPENNPGLPLPSRVFRVDWWGGNNLAPGAPLENIESFEITVLNRFSQEVLYSDTISVSAIDVQTVAGTVGPQNAAMHRFSYQSNQGQLFLGAFAGSISIAANYTNTPSPSAPLFLWANSFEGDDTIFESINGGPFTEFVTGAPNAAFALYGAIPTPGAASLLALAGLAATRRRR